MKKHLIIVLVLMMTASVLCGQNSHKNGISAYVGFGFSDNQHTTQNFTIGYQRLLSKSLFIFAEYADLYGSQSFESLLMETPKLDRSTAFGELYGLSEDDAFGRIIQVRSWSLGLKKYIQLSSKAFMAGGLSISSNHVGEMDMEGIIYENEDVALDVISYENAYPVYGNYSNIGAKVSLEFLVNIKENIGLTSKIEYLSFSSIVSASLGTTVSF